MEDLNINSAHVDKFRGNLASQNSMPARIDRFTNCILEQV